MTENTSRYDVYMRGKNLTEVPDPVRVEGRPVWDDRPYLSFVAETEDPYRVTTVALFPNLKVSRVVLVRAEDDESSEFRRGYTAGYPTGRSTGHSGPGEPETES